MIDDVDALPAMMADGVSAEYVQLEARPFRCRWSWVAYDDTVIQFGSEEVSTVRRIQAPASRWLFIVPLDVPAGARWNARAVDLNDLIMCPPGTSSLAFDPASTRFAIITAAMHTPLARLAGRVCGPLVQQPICGRSTERATELRDALEELRTMVEGERLLRPDALCSQICDALLGVLNETAVNSENTDDAKNGIVARAEAFFREHVSEGVSVAELSSVVGVSERSLRNAFHDVYTTSPKRYMKLWQLHQVRRALRAPTSDVRTVTEAATGNGLFELGRFAGAYKSLFGEPPSVTLHRAKKGVAVA